MNVRQLFANKDFVRKLGDLLETISAEPMIYRKDVMRRYDRTERCIDQWIANGTLPPPESYSGRSPRWRLYDLERAERRNPKLKKALSK